MLVIYLKTITILNYIDKLNKTFIKLLYIGELSIFRVLNELILILFGKIQK